MAFLNDIPVIVEHEDGTETTVTLAEAERLGLFKSGVKVEVQGTGFVRNLGDDD